jgi:hypothetical protein
MPHLWTSPRCHGPPSPLKRIGAVMGYLIALGFARPSKLGYLASAR